MRSSWVVFAIRPDQYQDLNNIKVYGPFPSKTKANEWIENRTNVWKMARIIRVVELDRSIYTKG